MWLWRKLAIKLFPGPGDPASGAYVSLIRRFRRAVKNVSVSPRTDSGPLRTTRSTPNEPRFTAARLFATTAE